MNILIVGAGAIGCYLGAFLSHGGHTVTLVGRARYAGPINADGLRLTGALADTDPRHAAARMVTTIDDAMAAGATYGAALLTLKLYDLPPVLEALKPYQRRLGRTLTFQNGLGAEALAAEALGRRHVIAGTVTTPVSWVNGNTLRIEQPGRGVGVAPLESGWSIQEWSDLFANAGINTIGYGEYEAMKWTKVLVNIIANATSAITGWTPEQIYADDALFDLERAQLDETVAVMAALDIPVVPLPGLDVPRLSWAMANLPRFLFKPLLTRHVVRARGENMPSFYRDLAARKDQSEVVYYNGAIARYGWQRGIPTPVNTTLTEVLLRLVRGEVGTSRFRNRPTALLDAVAARRAAWRHGAPSDTLEVHGRPAAALTEESQ